MRSAEAVRAPLPVGTAMPVVLAFTGFATERSLVLAVALLCAGGCAEIALHRTRRKRPA